TYSQTINSKTKMETIKKTDTLQQVLIDKFIVPQKSKQELFERMNINMNFIKKLPGFIEHTVYERDDEQGNLVIVTVALWENEDAIKKAKEAVQAEYKKQNFNLQEMLTRLNITIDRNIYKKVAN